MSKRDDELKQEIKIHDNRAIVNGIRDEGEDCDCFRCRTNKAELKGRAEMRKEIREWLEKRLTSMTSNDLRNFNKEFGE
jgi:hypothetical protein